MGLWYIIPFARYKNLQAYTAVAVEVQVVPRNGRIRLIRAATANDSGHMVHPDNISNQIEGGVIQGLSWALKEEVKFDDTSVLSSTAGRKRLRRTRYRRSDRTHSRFQIEDEPQHVRRGVDPRSALAQLQDPRRARQGFAHRGDDRVAAG